MYKPDIIKSDKGMRAELTKPIQKIVIPKTLKDAEVERERLQTDIRRLKMLFNYKILEILLRDVESGHKCSVCSVGEFSKVFNICCAHCPVHLNLTQEEWQKIIEAIDGTA